MKLKAWIEAMRLRTLPVSLSGVLWAAGLLIQQQRLQLIPLAMCLVFATLAQIASNFANEYFDFRDGLDRPGREGFRRGVTEGDLSARAMLRATIAVLLVACCVGVLLVALYGEWWMYLVGVATALGVLAYSTGPFPLSRLGLGELAVVCFFGLIPVVLTVLLSGGLATSEVWLVAVGVGLMGANVLMVNNYRDADDDADVGKLTLAVRYGRKPVALLYLLSGIAAFALTLSAWLPYEHLWSMIPSLLYLSIHRYFYDRLCKSTGAQLNPLLGQTAMLMCLYSVAFLIFTILS
ncbi:MAG: 1,4-dihydroxy-2-naphthoate octaprenyltransferase [Duncaniella sp.]|nr:1,4-dihydroxy-2-naphthoate octaprenyltransferase [Duncaniella sp.]